MRREEVDGTETQDQDRLNYFYNWMFNDPWYSGLSLGWERDPIRELDNRYTAGLLLGRDVFDDSHRFLTIFADVGYSDERIGGLSEGGAVGFWNLRYEHEFWPGVDFFHRQDFTQQFYGLDNLILKTASGFQLEFFDDFYTNISYRYDYETEAAEGASKDDSTLQLGIGYEF